MQRCISSYPVRLLALLLLAAICLPGKSGLALQNPPAAGRRAAQQPAVPDSEAVARWKELTRQRRVLQKELSNLLSNIPLGVPDPNDNQLEQIEQTRVQLNALKIETLAAAAEAYIESPETNFLMSRDALMHLRVLMGEDDGISGFNPILAHEFAERMIAAGSKTPQFIHVALRASIASQDFAKAREHLAQMEALGVQTNKPFLDRLDVLTKSWQRELEFRERDLALELPLVRIETDLGPITIELFEDDAPNTVNSFVSLVESGFYNNQEFFNVQAGFLAMSGCPLGNGTGNCGYSIPEETKLPTAREHVAGSLTTYHLQNQPTSSLFSLVLQPIPERNGEFTVFGRVIEGLDVLYSFPAFSPTDRMIRKQTVKITSASMLRKRPHEYKPAQMTLLDSAPATPAPPVPVDSKEATTPPTGDGGG